MKTIFYILIISSAMLTISFGQDRTEARKWKIDPETGDTVYYKEVSISQTEDITPRSSMIVINPLKFFLFYNISYYHELNEGTALGIGLQMPTLSGLSGVGINAEVRFYPRGRNLKGFYFAPNASYNSISDESGGTVSISSLGALFGWQWFPGEQFAMGLGIGVDYYFFAGENDSYSRINGAAPALRFDIGYAW